jgi:catalase
MELCISEKNSRGSRAVNYFPSTLHPEVTESKPLPHERYCFAQPLIVREDPPRFNDFEQAGNRWRSFSPERQQRFADRVALSLTGSMIPEELRKIWLDYWYEVDPNLNHMIIESLALLVEGVKPDDSESKIARFKSLETLKEAFALTSARSL